MSEVAILTEPALRASVPLDLVAVEVVENAFRALATRAVAMPPILRLDIPEHNGEVDVKTAYIPGIDSFAIKVSPGFFDNPKLGLPSLNGLMVLLSARTGLVEALLLDNGYLTDVRTAAAGAVAARHLAPEGIDVVGVLGSGLQARLQIQALALVRPFSRVLVWGRDRARAAACADDLAQRLELEARALSDPAAVVAESEIVVTTTPARRPILMADWLHPGLHVTSVGSDAEDKNELDPRCLVDADLFVCDRRGQSARLGELHHAVSEGAVPEDFPAVELGEIVAGTATGRTSTGAVTICDLTGTGAQDTAIAAHAFDRARRQGLGAVVDSRSLG